MAKPKKKPAPKSSTTKSKPAKKSTASRARAAPKKVKTPAKPGRAEPARRRKNAATGPRPITFKKPGNIPVLALTPTGEDAFEVVYDPANRKLRPEAVPARELVGHTAFVQALAFSADGTRLVSGSEDGAIRVWDPATGACLATSSEHESAVNFVAFTPDGRLLSVSDDRTMKLWSFPQLACVRTFAGHADYVSKVRAAGNDRAVTASKDGTVRVWDLETGDELRRMEPGGWVLALGVSHDGKGAVTANDRNTMTMWNLETGEAERQIMDASGGYAGNLMGLTVAATNTGKGHGSYPKVIVFAADDQTFLSAEKALIEWDTATGDELRVIEGDGWPMNGIAIIPDRASLLREHGDPEERPFIEQLERGDRDVRTVYGDWLEDRGRIAEAASVREHGAFRYVLAVSSDAIHVFDLAAKKVVAQARWEHGDLHTLAISPDGRTAACGSNDGPVAVWDVDELLRAGMPDRHLRRPTSNAVSDDGIALTTSMDRTARLWTRDGTASVRLPPTASLSVEVEFPRPDLALVMSENSTLAGYSATGELRGTARIPPPADDPSDEPYWPFIERIFLPDDSLLVGSVYKPLAVYPLDPIATPRVFGESAGHVTAMALDGELAVTGESARGHEDDSMTLATWNIATGTRVARYAWRPRTSQFISSIRIIRDEYAIATSGGAVAFIGRDGEVRAGLQLPVEGISFFAQVGADHVIAGGYLIEVAGAKVVGVFAELADAEVCTLAGTSRAVVTTNAGTMLVDFAARTKSPVTPPAIRFMATSANRQYVLGISEAEAVSTMPVLLRLL